MAYWRPAALHNRKAARFSKRGLPSVLDGPLGEATAPAFNLTPVRRAVQGRTLRHHSAFTDMAEHSHLIDRAQDILGGDPESLEARRLDSILKNRSQ